MTKAIDVAVIEKAAARMAVAAPINVTDRTPKLIPVARAPHVRRTWSGTYDGATLTVLRGAWIVDLDKAGDESGRRHDPRRVSPIELGDHVVVYSKRGPALALLEVTAVIASGWTVSTYGAAVRLGDVRDVRGECFVLPATGLRR